ncbi:MAG: peptidoglycan DD-metalloendopeptidase family protein [Acidimicrobiia bacterium]|nr:MAG: peptidoglycan DD-metalloendopeptidase family protein [Acidimicrobiia bacterium]
MNRPALSRPIVALVSLTLVMLVAAPAWGEVTKAQLSEAREKVNERSDSLEEQLAKIDAVLVQQALFEERIDRLREDIAERERQIALSAFAAREQARDMYVNAGASAVTAAGSPETITVLGTKDAYLEAVVDIGVDAVNQLVFLQQDRRALEDQLEALVGQQEDLAAELSAVSSEMMRELSEANDEYQVLYSQWEKEEAERRRKAAEEAARRKAAAAAAAARANNYASSAFVDPSGRTCPVAGANTFRDSWLEPRPYRNGVHHGTDLVAAEGTPLVAMEAGYVYSMGYHWAGGNGIYIRGNSGDIYYYAHLQKFASGISTGDRVGVAQTIGYVGSTGASSMPHLHLGYQPGGGALVNPYQLLLKLCR